MGLGEDEHSVEASFQVKIEIIGPDPGQQREARVLNRVIRWEETGITWEPDPRHAEIMVEQMGFKGGRPLKIPGVKEEKKNDRELRADIDHIISENNYSDQNMNPEQKVNNTEGACRRETTNARRRFVVNVMRVGTCALSCSDTSIWKDTSSAVTARGRTSNTSTESLAAEAERRPAGESGNTTG